MHVPRLFYCFVILGSATLSQTLYAGIVTSTADSGPGSLRAAVSSAVNGEIITFAPSLGDSTVVLTGGELAISGLQLSIDASALSRPMKISGNNSSRVFRISNNANVSLNSLEILDGRSLNDNGGGIYAIESQLDCINVTIRNCIATIDGGGLWANNVTGSLDRCSMLGNDTQGYGGGIYLIGIVSPTLKNAVISGNRGAVGGGISILAASPSLTNCTIQGNSGVGIQLEFSAAPALMNTIVWGNRTGGGSISSQQIQNGSGLNLDYCLIEGLAGTLNNLDGTLASNNPNFVKPATPANSTTPPTSVVDHRFYIGSPVINKGNNNILLNPTSLDRAGKPRVQNTTIDLGAFEAGYVTFGLVHPSLIPAGDANGNGRSNFLEYASGIDPTAPDNPSARPQLSMSGGFHFLTSSQRSDALDIDSFWQTSTTLESLSWQKMVLGVNYTVESTTTLTPSRRQVVMKLIGAGNRRFYRQSITNSN